MLEIYFIYFFPLSIRELLIWETLLQYFFFLAAFIAVIIGSLHCCNFFIILIFSPLTTTTTLHHWLLLPPPLTAAANHHRPPPITGNFHRSPETSSDRRKLPLVTATGFFFLNRINFANLKNSVGFELSWTPLVSHLAIVHSLWVVRVLVFYPLMLLILKISGL